MWLKRLLVAMIVMCIIGYFNRDRIFYATGEYHERQQYYIAAYQAYKKIPQYCPGSPLVKKAREKMAILSNNGDVKKHIASTETDLQKIQAEREKRDSFR